ncbi:uncharacterized protein EAE97_000089 [Botrytis byssoidea]|uniref:Uncharacterized protein n=1 Tax=Botrytis byssoidea TaxID=139641 RepID=A0A9P5IZU4_9HELO|nr:uncharacterized protein EAE97_000089 [Botrytis byssoidea]KAF7954830.1 hypothetical protein EAE97_000089 [Botrytis byssoidea]
MPSWNNWSVYHTIAALEILVSKKYHAKGGLTLTFGVGLGAMASQHPSADGNSAPAAAMIIVSNADDTSPVVWVHNNELGSDEENNGVVQRIGCWRGFSPPNDLESSRSH